MRYPTMAGFVGHEGNNVWLDPHGYDDDHPVVLAHPELFTDTPPSGEPEPEPKPEPKPKRSTRTVKAQPKEQVDD